MFDAQSFVNDTNSRQEIFKAEYRKLIRGLKTPESSSRMEVVLEVLGKSVLDLVADVQRLNEGQGLYDIWMVTKDSLVKLKKMRALLPNLFEFNYAENRTDSDRAKMNELLKDVSNSIQEYVKGQEALIGLHNIKNKNPDLFDASINLTLEV